MFGLAHLALVSARAQDAPNAPAFRAGVDLVALNVTLTDHEHRFVGGLTEKDFSIYEDGVQQDISYFSAGRMPLDLAVLLDTSASMTNILSIAQDAAVGFVRTAQAGDRVTVIEISDRANVLVPLGGEIDSAVDAIRHTTARGSTALYNALYLALSDMKRHQKSDHDVRRQAIAVLSDGQDTSSLVQFDDVMTLAKSAGIAVYSIALMAPTEEWRLSSSNNKGAMQAQFVMRSLAQETGGLPFVAQNAHALDGIYTEIAKVLAQQYTLGYVSKNSRSDNAYRRVSVRVSNHPGVTARTRTGYYATRGRLLPLSN